MCPAISCPTFAPIKSHRTMLVNRRQTNEASFSQNLRIFTCTRIKNEKTEVKEKTTNQHFSFVFTTFLFTAFSLCLESDIIVCRIITTLFRANVSKLFIICIDTCLPEAFWVQALIAKIDFIIWYDSIQGTEKNWGSGLGFGLNVSFWYFGVWKLIRRQEKVSLGLGSRASFS